MKTTIFTGHELSRALQARNRRHVAQLGRSPVCVTLLDEASPPAVAYLNRQIALASAIGVTIHPQAWSAQNPAAQLTALAKHPQVDAIATLYPLPKGLSPQEAADLVGAQKDADGLHRHHAGDVMLGSPTARVPATAMAAYLCARQILGTLKGADITLVGTSSLIGKPLSMLLGAAGATVTLCHIETKDLARHTMSADLVISAAGVPQLLGQSHIAKGGMVLDLSIVRVASGLVGDCDLAALQGHAALISHVPDGVGPVTTACLFANIIAAAKGCAPDYGL